MIEPRGDFIGGAFHPPKGDALISVNPARGGEVVFETGWTPDRADLAADAADAAASEWMAIGQRERLAHLGRFREAIAGRAEGIADAIVLETGKLRSEARGEVSALLGRFDLVHHIAGRDLAEGPVDGNWAEQLRYHPLGVVGIIGPFNYPLHLCHAHAVPALLLGNAVVIKVSEVTPLCGQRYAEAAQEAGFPAGVFNLVQGRGESGARLVEHPALRGLCFTGSYPVGRRIQERALDRPELLVALEMGGKNAAVVLDDADVRQAAHEIATGGYLTAGQRCTATDRVLVSRRRADELLAALRPLVESLRMGDPEDPRSFAGPMVTADARARLADTLEKARAAGAEPLVSPRFGDDGYFAGASLHRLPDGCHDVPGYTDHEVFGPDVAVEVIDDDDEAIAVLRASAYGFANSVFTSSDERFERMYRETRSGILNRNRSTNQASPRLPFGGLGKSGNYRPAGGHAHRNVVAAVAVQENVLGAIDVHPHLADVLRRPDLERLETQHAAEENAEAGRRLLDEPRPLSLLRPPGGSLPKSDNWLTRLYAGERMVREKKPAVFDHLRSSGPWFVSIDDEPLCVLDGMSQTATVCGGFAEDPVVRTYVEGGFGEALLRAGDGTDPECEQAQALATEIRHLVPGLPHVAFCSSGAEANEKALALCQQNAPRPEANKILAFEGGFHGRTLLALHATYNPQKREPFQIAGYEATFAPFPAREDPLAEEPPAPPGFYAAAGIGDIDTLLREFDAAEEDPLLAAEVRSLAAVSEALATGEYLACVVEPMQSEGGDRYATSRFFRALRLLTRHHDAFLIFDEVQTGFALGGPFAWHTQFRLVNFRGQPDVPDVVTFAKRAQVGVCLSRFEDPEPSPAPPASLLRGRIHAEMMAMAHHASRLEKLVVPRLRVLAEAFPHLVSRPRAQGFAFAFDLPSPAHLRAYLGQRFWRGAIVFAAGDRTVRYRLSESYHAREVEELFATVRRSLAWLDAHPGAQPPRWEDPAVPDRRSSISDEVQAKTLTPDEALEYLPAMLDIEYRVYEPARRTSPVHIREALEHPEGVVTIGEIDGELAGFAIGVPLEASTDVEGPDRDPMLGRENSLYSVSLTIVPEHQGRGVGRALKKAQLAEAARRERDDGSPRYRYVTGRNRVGHTARMTHLNRAYGAHIVCVLTGQYEDPEGQAIYYRIPLGPLAPDPELRGEPESSAAIRADRGVVEPLSEPPESLRRAEEGGLLYGPAVNKITVTNYVTPAAVRAVEWVSALLPELPHMYLASGRDEALDKALRICRYHRNDAATAIGLEGGYVGHTTAAARSISDPAVHRQGAPHFSWPRVPHPGRAGIDATIAALEAAIEEAGGPGRVLGLVFELVQERRGDALTEAHCAALAEVRARHGIPLVAVETASACYRSALGPFASPALGLCPDILLWWGGAHAAYLHVTPGLRVSKPLTMVSTWDGDELSLVREHHQLRALRRLDLSPAVAALDAAAARAEKAGLSLRGRGCYRVLHAGSRADELKQALAARGVIVRPMVGGAIPFAPGLDRAEKAAEILARCLEEVA